MELKTILLLVIKRKVFLTEKERSILYLTRNIVEALLKGLMAFAKLPSGKR